jgi:hypothetical protein
VRPESTEVSARVALGRLIDKRMADQQQPCLLHWLGAGTGPVRWQATDWLAGKFITHLSVFHVRVNPLLGRLSGVKAHL